MKHPNILRVFCLLLAAAVCLGGTAAFASDYSYLGSSAGIYVSADGITEADDVSLETAQTGEVTDQDGVVTISGTELIAREIGDWSAGSASGEASGEASSSQAGQSGIYIEDAALVQIGGEEDVFEASDGRMYNTVVELWADDADTENGLSLGTTRGEPINDVETWTGVGLSAVTDMLYIDNTYILTEGPSRTALLTSGDNDTVIRNSRLVSLSDGWIVPAHICISRAARTALLTSSGNTWIYNSAILSTNWGTYSMDAADGIDYLYIINSYSENYQGGYGLYILGMGEDYAEGNNHVYMYGSRFVSPQYGMIFSNGPYMYMGSMADMASDEHAMDEYDGTIEPEEYLTDSGESVLAGANNAAIITFDMHAAPDMIGKFVAENSTLSTAAEDLTDENGDYVGHVMDYYGASVLNEDAIAGGFGWFGVNYVRGSVFWLRGANAEIVLDNVTMRSETGVLFQSTMDYTNNSSSNMAGQECLGIDITMSNMEAEGDILHEDYQRVMTVTLDNTTLTGAATWLTVEEYAAKVDAYLAETYPEAEEIKAQWEAETGGESLLGSVEDIRSWFVYDETYDESLGGLEIVLENASVWSVTDASRLTKLTIGEDCTLDGVLTVNGETVDAVPGTYEGDIVITPAAADSDLVSMAVLDGEAFVKLDDILSALGF